MTEGTKS